MNIKLIERFPSNASGTILAKIEIDGIIKIVKYRFYTYYLKKFFTYLKNFNSKKKLKNIKYNLKRTQYIKNITDITGNIEKPYNKWLTTDLKLLSDRLAIISEKIELTMGLEYEADVYELLRNLEIHKYSPHFIKTYHGILNVSVISHESHDSTSEFAEIWKEMIGDSLKSNDELNNVNGVVMEYCDKCKLYGEIMHDKTLSEKDQVVILFQVLYNLTVIRRLEIQHNDLHLSNILIKKSKRPQTRLYCIGNNTNRWYSITSQYSVKFFDWDLAYSPKIGKNKKIEGFFCDTYDICNTLHPLFDQTIVLCQLMRAHPNKSIKTFLKNNTRLSVDLINTAVVDCRVSAINMLKYKNTITSSTSLMKNSFFDTFKINKNSKINKKNYIYFTKR